MRAESPYNFLRNRNIRVLILCRIIWGLSQSLFTPYFSLFALAQEGVTPELLGIIVSAKAIGMAILAPPAGYLADSIGRRRMIVAGTLLHSASYLFYLAATDYRMILLGSLIEGLSIIHFPALQAITQDSLSRDRRGLGISATTGLQALPQLISPFIGGILAESLGIDMGMRIGFALAFGAGLLVAFIRFKYLQETLPEGDADEEHASLLELLEDAYFSLFRIFKKYRSLRGLVILAFFDTFFGSITAPFWIVYAETFIGLSPVEWGMAEITASAVSIGVLLFSGRLTDRYGSKRVIFLNLLAAPVINISFIYCQDFSQVLIFRILIAIQNAFMMPAASALLANTVSREERGKTIAAIGWQPIVISLGAVSHGFLRFPAYFAGSFLSGYIYEADPHYPWFLLAGSYVLMSAICLFLIEQPEKIMD